MYVLQVLIRGRLRDGFPEGNFRLPSDARTVVLSAHTLRHKIVVIHTRAHKYVHTSVYISR